MRPSSGLSIHLFTCTSPSPYTPGRGSPAEQICRLVFGSFLVHCAIFLLPPAAYVDCKVAGPAPPAQATNEKVQQRARIGIVIFQCM